MSGKLVTRASEFDIARARALGNQYDPDVYGRFPWVTRDYGNPESRALTLTRTRLGIFVECVLRNGGNITNFFVMRPDYPRSYVQAALRLTVQGREAVIKETGIGIEPPPVVHLNTE